jgi:sterol desaturase/sphingolipid hydroxylase (fatty acid hydroxylase superfamily)
MEFLSAVGDRWLTTVAWLAGLGAVFAVLARLFPCNPGMYWWKDRRAVLTDLVYWFLVPLVMLLGRGFLFVAAALLLFGGPPPPTAVSAWPFWAQVVAVFVLQDVLIYWLHRLFHTRPLWPFHAVHHSPHVLDWTATARFHPVNQLLEFALADVVVLLLGFPPVVLVAVAPFNLVYSAMVHANLNWTFGPLRYVFASPVFHRWHHTSEAEGLDKNFAPTFPFLDLLFGTFHMPAGKRPEAYGAGEPPVPAGFWGQFVHPFRDLAPVRWAKRQPGLAMVATGLVAGGLLCGWAEVKARLALPTGLTQTDRRP